MFNAPGFLQTPGPRLGYRIPYHKNTELTLFLYQAILDSILKRLFTEARGEIRRSGKNVVNFARESDPMLSYRHYTLKRLFVDGWSEGRQD